MIMRLPAIILLVSFSLSGCFSTPSADSSAKEASGKNQKEANKAKNVQIKANANKKPFELARQYIETGKQHSASKKYRQAQKYFVQAIKLDPKNPEIYGLAGNASKKLFEYDTAIGFYQKVLKLLPYDIRTYGRIGHTQKILKRYKKSIATFEKILAIDADEYRAIDELIDIYFATGDYKNCLYYLDEFELAISNLDKDFLSEKTKEKIEKKRRTHSSYRNTILASSFL